MRDAFARSETERNQEIEARLRLERAQNYTPRYIIISLKVFVGE